MHEMQPIITDVCGVRQSVCHECRVHGSFGAALAKFLWPRVFLCSFVLHSSCYVNSPFVTVFVTPKWFTIMKMSKRALHIQYVKFYIIPFLFSTSRK